MSTLNAQARNVGRLGIIPDMPRLDGACVGYPTDWWFSDRPQSPTGDPHWREPKRERTQRLVNKRNALAICRDCPVLERCRDYTEQHPEMTAYGIWAGTTGAERTDANGRRGRRVAA